MTTLAEIEAAARSLSPEELFQLKGTIEELAAERTPAMPREINADTSLTAPGPPLTAEELNRVLSARLKRYRQDPSKAGDAFEFLDELDAEDAAEVNAEDAARHAA